MNANIFESSLIKRAFAPGPLTTAAGATAGTIIDTLGYQDITFLITADNGASGVVTAQVESDLLVGFGSATDITGATVAITEAGEANTGIIRVHLAKRERFVRVELTATVANAAGVAVIAILENPYGTVHKPVTQGLAAVTINT